jgi:hypothetical protein
MPTPTVLSSAKAQKPARVAAAPTVTPSAVASSPPKPAPTAKPAARKPTVPPTSTPAAATADDNASSLVRSYLAALARGDRTTAASYLSHGAPNETFMNGNARIESIRSANVGPQRYQVTADIQTSGGEYYVTFTVEQGPSGLQIVDHYSIKPQ